VRRVAALISTLLALSGGAALAQTASLPTSQPLSGQIRLQQDDLQANTGLARPPPVPSGYSTLEAELRASGHGLTAVVTLQQRQQDDASDNRAWVNELYASHDGGAWQFSAGKKIVSWDVGYGFRPNDMVQQEARRSLVGSTLEGRPLLLAEHFDASTAWSFVWVNPTGSMDDPAGKEPALAVRFYQRAGAVDWYGFARNGAQTGASVGAAVAWVASDALELHGSVRLLNHASSQVLLGGTWTTESQVSLLTEAWWDGTAALQRNLMLRLSWQHEGWQPALDVLYTPADRGRVLTASLSWQGDRVQVQGGLRVYGGPADALVMQSPVRRQAYCAMTWAF
jgi:hypothetical protein